MDITLLRFLKENTSPMTVAATSYIPYMNYSHT